MMLNTLKNLLKDAAKASLEMFKVMIPIILLVKVFQELGLIQYLAWPLTPIMGPLGLPPEMGLVWGTAIINTTYAGLIVFLSLASETTLTVAQASVLSVLILVAHSLPMESSIARKSGARFFFQCFIRLTGALILGFLLHIFFTTTGLLQEQAIFAFHAAPEITHSTSLFLWVLDQIRTLGSIFFIILGLMTIMRILQFIKVIDLINRVLRPILKAIGIGPKASAITVIGLTMGLSYGGGLIINEARNETIGKKDVFYSLTLMGLCHSLIEDTFLLMLIGSNFHAIFWGRLFFAIMVMAGIVQIVRMLPASFTGKYLWVRN
ncbi:hypothetical protein [Pseudodesulfovibrio piezophilus]|nr:hypothetical protein [Pseudodesulfovibrio piezophilus]